MILNTTNNIITLHSICSIISYYLWYNLNINPIHKSTAHSIIAFCLPLHGNHSFFLSFFSTGYYLADLHFTNEYIYIIHHLVSIYFCRQCLFYPYNKHNIIGDIMFIEGSVPFLNIYIYF